MTILLLVVIFQVQIVGLSVGERKGYAPVFIDGDGPRTGAVSLKFMEPETGKIQSFNVSCDLDRAENVFHLAAEVGFYELWFPGEQLL
jgi:hypothetical protein